jgi:hypothetical protein
MKNLFKVMLVGLTGLGSISLALQALQTTNGPAAPPTAVLENGSILYAEISKTVDAKKAKVGDPVTAQLLADVIGHGKILLRRDSKLMGHVTEVQARSQENPESRLGIVFEKAMPKGGQEMPFRSVLLALRPAPRITFDVPSAPAPPGTNPAAGPAQERHYPVPKGGPAPKMNPTMATRAKERDEEMAGTGETDIEGLSLTSANNGGQAVVSLKRTVKLESGVRIELRVMGAAQ